MLRPLGLGEATYGSIAPALLSDLFSPKVRGRVIGLYFLALPLGGALGYGIGGWVADTWHWRMAFWVVGLPGIVAAVAGLLMHDPGRGASEGKAPAGKADRPRLADYLDLLRTPTFLYNTFGMAAVTFATGAWAVYASDFYQTVHGMRAKDAGKWIGGMTAVAGLVGISLGMWLPDLLSPDHLHVPTWLAGLPGGRRGDDPGPARADRTEPEHVAAVALLGDDPDGDGSRPVQHGDGERRPGESARDGLLGEHLPDPRLRRHQLADPDRVRR